MMKAALLLIAVCAGWLATAADDSPEKQLNQVRAQMGYALKTLPDYVCVQKTERLHASKAKAKLKAIDTVELEVAHVDGGEMYSWPGQSMFAESKLRKNLPYGLVGSGAYSSQVIDVLFGLETQFHWAGKETLGPRATVRWDFTLPQAQSNWLLGGGQSKVRVGASGSLWADAETLAIVRLEARAEQIPVDFPLKAVTRVINYASVQIGGRTLLLPATVEDRVVKALGEVSFNRSHFEHCREFSATSTLQFDEAAETKAVEPFREAVSALPPNVRIQLALDEHIRSASCVIGEVVNAHVTSDVHYAGKVLAPKGTPVRGVLREFSKRGDGLSSFYSLMVEFSSIDLPGGTVPFRAQLRSVDSPMEGLSWLVPSGAGRMRMEHSGRGNGGDDSASEITIATAPGVGVLMFLRVNTFDISSGTRMTWGY